MGSIHFVSSPQQRSMYGPSVYHPSASLTVEELTALIHTYENDPEMSNLPAANFSVAQPQTTSPTSMGTVTISRTGAHTSR